MTTGKVMLQNLRFSYKLGKFGEGHLGGFVS